MESLILTIIATSIPLLLAATGELIAEKSGVLNLGVEGMMLSGAVGALGAVLWLENPYFRNSCRSVIRCTNGINFFCIYN